MTRLPTSPHQDTVHHGSFPSRVNPTKPSCRSLQHGIYTFPPEELLASFGYIDTSSVLVSTSLNHISGETIWSYTKIDHTIHHMNHIIIYLYACYKLQFSHHIFLVESTPHPALEPGWKGREICAPNEAQKSGAEEIPLIFQSYRYISSHRYQIDTFMIYHDINLVTFSS